MNFCSHCGHALEERVPPGDDRPRKACPACQAVHYQNPRTVVGCLVEHEGGVLLCRRAIDPRHGFWTPPAGYLEMGETARAGAARETWEEARALVEVEAPLVSIDLPEIGQIYTLFRARLAEARWAPGPESLAVELFDLDALPLDELAFPVFGVALELLRADREAGTPRLHLGSLEWSGSGDRMDPASYTLEQHQALTVETDD